MSLAEKTQALWEQYASPFALGIASPLIMSTADRIKREREYDVEGDSREELAPRERGLLIESRANYCGETLGEIAALGAVGYAVFDLAVNQDPFYFLAALGLGLVSNACSGVYERKKARTVH